jgi:protocatechuate 3,4-dioxygenase, alpha subunit
MTGESRPVATPSQTVGPFFHFGLATNAALGTVAPPDAPGERIRVGVRVLDGDGLPVPDALVEIYQADADGVYGRAPFDGFGRLPTDADGRCVFETIRPGPVAHAANERQAPHINVCLLARGLLRQVYTRMYFAGDAEHAGDPLLALVPAERRETLIAQPAAGESLVWEFVIRLQGDAETVFFDL